MGKLFPDIILPKLSSRHPFFPLRTPRTRSFLSPGILSSENGAVGLQTGTQRFYFAMFDSPSDLNQNRGPLTWIAETFHLWSLPP
jgi:hypothetical protein